MRYDADDPGSGAPPARHLARQHELVWTSGSGERLVYHYATDRGKAFVHPLRTASSEILTALEPADHPWHRGLWFAWKYLNGVNFWEETAHRTSEGQTAFVGPLSIIYHGGHTRVTTRYQYLEPTGTVLLFEQRTLQIQVPPAGPNVIDWDASFTAGAHPVQLGSTGISPSTPWGGYAGLSFRAAPSFRAVQGIDSEGREGGAIKHQRARWVQLTGTNRIGFRCSVAMFDHPENPRYPSHWYYADERDPLGFVYLNPSLVLAEPYTMRPLARFRLRYRLLVFDGALTRHALDRQHARYARHTKKACAGQRRSPRDALW